MIADLTGMIERILLLLGGILSIYLGYRCFSLAAIEDKGSWFEWIELGLSRVAPGLFFSLFGAYILLDYLKHLLRISSSSKDEGTTC